MMYRRRQRWLRRLALGLAFATVAVGGQVAPAFAKPTAAQDPYLTDVFVRQGDSLGGPDGRNLSSGVLGVTDIQIANAPTAIRPDDRAVRFTGVQRQPVRPDNRADRFAHSDVTAQPGASSSAWNVEWNQAIPVGIGGLVLALAVVLGIGYLRRPKLAL